MKKMVLCLALFLLAFSGSMSAQTEAKSEEKNSEQQRIDAMVKVMEDRLMLKESDCKKFASLYSQYVEDIAAATPQEMKVEPKNDAERMKALKESFKLEEKCAKIKIKYLEKFSKILSPRQLETFYSLESRMEAEKNCNNRRGSITKNGSYRVRMFPHHRQSYDCTFFWPQDSVRNATDIVPDKRP